MNSSWFLMLPLQNLQRCQRYPPMTSRPVLSQPEGQSLNARPVLLWLRRPSANPRPVPSRLWRPSMNFLVVLSRPQRPLLNLYTAPKWPRSRFSSAVKNLGELHKEWIETGVKASRAPHTDVSRNLATVVVRGVLPGLRRRRTGLLPSGPKSSFQMRASFVFHLETKVLESGGRVEKLIAQVAWSPVLSFHSLWWFGCNVICTPNSNWSPPCHAELKQKEPLLSIEYIYSKWTYFPEGQQFTIFFYWS